MTRAEPLVCCAQPATESPEALTHRAGAPWISCQPSTPAELGPHSGLKIKVNDLSDRRAEQEQEQKHEL